MNRFKKQNSKPDAKESASKPALRDFKDDAQTTPPSMFLFRLEVTSYWLLPLTIFCVILIGGIYVAYKYDWFSGEYVDVAPRPSYVGESGEIIVPQLLSSHLSAVGGREALESVQSLRFKGVLKEPTGDVAFQILVSLPDKGMIMTEPSPGVRHKLVLNGELAWQVFETGEGVRKIVALNEVDTESLVWSLRVHNTFRRLALEGSADGFTSGEIEFMGKPCYQLTKIMPDGTEFVAVLDADTLYLLKSLETVPGAEGPERLEVIYAEHRKVAGVVEAFQTKTYKEGKLYNEVVLNSIEINPGLISALFDVPEELSN